MSASNVRLRHSGRSGTSAADGSSEYEEVYLVDSDSSEDGAVTVEAAVIAFNETYGSDTEADSRAYLVSKQSVPLDTTADGTRIWLVICRYSTAPAPPGIDPSNVKETPSDRRTEWAGGTEDYIDHPGADLDDKPFVNTANDRYGADVSATPKGYVVFTATKVLDFDPLTQAAEWTPSVNVDDFHGLPKGTVKLARMRWREVFEAGAWYYPTTFEFHYKKDDADVEKSWYRKEVDRGYYYWKLEEEGVPDFTNPDNHVLARAGDSSAHDEVLLDGNGGELAIAADHTATVNYNYFRIYKQVMFTDFNLE